MKVAAWHSTFSLAFHDFLDFFPCVWSATVGRTQGCRTCGSGGPTVGAEWTCVPKDQPEGRRRLPALSARVFGVSVSTHHPDAGKCALSVLKIVNFSPYVFILYSRVRAFFQEYSVMLQFSVFFCWFSIVLNKPWIKWGFTRKTTTELSADTSHVHWPQWGLCQMFRPQRMIDCRSLTAGLQLQMP